mgnify:CR=1 FL=1
MSGFGPMVPGALASIAATAERGPRPPALVCRVCDQTIVVDFVNPLLEARRRLGQYAGEITGGLGVCERCAASHEADRAARQEGQRGVINLPDRETATTLDRFEITPGTARAVEGIRRFVARPDHDVYLFGLPGLGKTTLCCRAARQLVQTGRIRTAVYVRVPELLERLKMAMFDEVRQAGELGRLETYERAGLLILDDLGAEKPSDFARVTIEQIYTARLDAARPTLLTSNHPLSLTAEDQQKPLDQRRYRWTLTGFLDDDRLASRISGAAEIVELTGQDYRARGWRAVRRSEGAA